MIGYALCGSFCTLAESLDVMRRLVEAGEEILPIMSENVYSTDTRFFRAADLISAVRRTTGRDIVHTVKDAEPLGPATPLSALIIAPCTGNTLAKLAGGITDTAVTMAAKAHLRQDRPLLIAAASNDMLSANLKNIGTLLCRRSVYFVPMRQDDPIAKPHSLVASFSMIPEALERMRRAQSCRPLFLT